MNPAEIIFGGGLVLVLLGLAGYYAARQIKALEKLRRQTDLSPEDRLYIRKQVQRRLLCSTLMVVSAGMLIGWFFLENQIRTEVAAIQEADQPPDEAERKSAVTFFTIYWIVFLLLWLIILFLAGGDLLATARFGMRHQRQLEAERRNILENQIQRLRQERNGHQA